ncbi:peptidylprolyl isomerase [Ichthyenterobacterium sp. W332]|uniref:peptidylprolyl isomerase n=1 Tax=Microcosmobacter mediterraneus TaxID=3075607 RepID=A0ABU2YHL8_9FLAO|nr:peptidylprolyl isomerase [Ichthyenterobacterium sp. W332]MDT0557189.1 peptidylprolyl isomerase [Ichthyenterobacterium sp. W332]
MINKSLKFLVIAALVLVSSCKAQHPDLDDGIYAEIVTNKGTMVAKLFYDKVPVTVANFVALAEGNHPMVDEKYKGKPFYDSLTFHRVMDQFMIQGGDPTATGGGTPGYRFAADFHPDLKHDRPGLLSMANSGGINTNGSQFFITEVPYPSLDIYDANGNLKPCDQPRVSCHSVFGELVKGIEIQDSISNVEVVNPQARNHKPVKDVIITDLNIIRKGSAAKSFNAPKVFEEEMPKVEDHFNALKEEAKAKAEEAEKLREETNALAGVDMKVLFDEYNKDLIELPSGLKMHYITKGEGAKPAQGANVKLNYQGHFTDGRLFDSNLEDVEKKHYGELNPQKVSRGMYKPMDLKISPDARVVAGFKEGAAQMSVGDKAYLLLPSHLAWGERGAGGGFIPPNADVVFIIEMLEIVE